MKKILAVILCLAMLLGLCALVGCKKDKDGDGNGSEATYDTVKANLVSRGYTIEEYEESHLSALEQEFYHEYGAEMSFKKAFSASCYSVQYGIYWHVSAVVLSSSKDASTFIDCISSEHNEIYQEGNLVIAASHEKALNDALEGANSDSSISNPELFNIFVERAISQGCDMQFLSSYEIDEFENELARYGVSVTFLNIAEGYNSSGCYAHVYELASEADAQRLYNAALTDENVYLNDYFHIVGHCIVASNSTGTLSNVIGN